MSLQSTPARQPSPGACPSFNYGSQLLRRTGFAAGYVPPAQPHPAQRLADSGLLNLTGHSSGAPIAVPVALATCADEALEAYRHLCQKPVLPSHTGAELLTERADLTGLRRNGSRSTGGHCRLLPTASGTMAVNLARDSDWELIPAWLQRDGAQSWTDIRQALLGHPTEDLLERARLLGLAVADATRLPKGPANWMGVQRIRAPGSSPQRAPRVIDLSSLWAGPLCSRLWQAAGAEVIKIESRLRPDGGRRGSAEFFDLLNAGKTELTLDLHTADGRQALRELILHADIVLEASRPRALRQMGLYAEELLRAKPGLTWVSITGYGRGAPQENWIAYGDDAAIAAGLSAVIQQACGQWLVCGDAIADPLTGIHAAIAGWAGWLQGGGCLLDLSLAATVSHCLDATAPARNDYQTRYRQWADYLAQGAPPSPR